MKKIAIITGASSGMGKVFAETINTYDTFDEVWVIARRLDRLESLQETVPFPVRPIALDLTDRESFIRVQLTDAQGHHAWSNPVARQWIR